MNTVNVFPTYNTNSINVMRVDEFFYPEPSSTQPIPVISFLMA
jgi:hypothetical protein